MYVELCAEINNSKNIQLISTTLQTLLTEGTVYIHVQHEINESRRKYSLIIE